MMQNELGPGRRRVVPLRPIDHAWHWRRAGASRGSRSGKQAEASIHSPQRHVLSRVARESHSYFRDSFSVLVLYSFSVVTNFG